MLDKVGSALQDAVKRLLRMPLVDEAAIKALIRDLQRVLLQADVNVKLVLSLSKRIEERSLKEEPPAGVTRREHVLKVLYDELTRFLGEKTSALPFEPSKRNIIMLVGIQGSGKTTGAVKLARFLKKRGIKSALVCADIYRPGAFIQLKQLATTAGIPVFGDENERDAVAIAKRGVEYFGNHGYDAVIVDTAGRHKDEAELIKEMKEISAAIQPDGIILVIDGTIGQVAMSQAQAFHDAAPIGAIYVAKLDGSARAGGALSAVASTHAPIMFIGTGEKIEDIELFDPPRFVGRLLGMGDIKSLVEKVREAQVQVSEKKATALMSGRFTLTDMFEQLENLKKLGPLGKVLKLVPGLSTSLPEDAIQTTEERMKTWKAILQSMRKEERDDPRILSTSRIRRIARGSGTTEKNVKELVQQYEATRKMMRNLMRRRFAFKGLDKRMLASMEEKLNP